MPESIRWLVANKQYDKAEALLRRAAKFNSVELPDDPLNIKANKLSRICDESTGDRKLKKYSIIDMFTSPTLCKRSFILFYTW